MFIALDKLQNQGINKVIVAVPEKAIGASFNTTQLKKEGFFLTGVRPQNITYVHRVWKKVKCLLF